MTTTIKPLGDFIWVAPLADDADTPYVDNIISQQGLLMVVQRQKAASRGYVRAIGPGKRKPDGTYTKMPPIILGDLVRWTQGSAQRIELSGEKMYIVSASALIGVEKP